MEEFDFSAGYSVMMKETMQHTKTLSLLKTPFSTDDLLFYSNSSALTITDLASD